MKYYAVKNGRKIGIFRSWDECKAQVHGFPGAIYKSFITEEEAKSFINKKSGVGYGNKTEKQLSKLKTIVAYVDGSFFNGMYGSGVVMLKGKDIIVKEISQSGCDPEWVEMRNVAGEIIASMLAVNEAINEGFEKIIIYYDYEGIEKWATGLWKANKIGTQNYRSFMRRSQKDIVIEFVKVKGHSNDKYNDVADKLAKKSLGI